MKRVLLLSTTTGYQLRSFNDAAERLGIDLVFATDRCHHLDDPWQDRAIAVQFHDEPSSVAAVLAESAREPLQGVISVGDRPTRLTARLAEVLRLPGNSPEAAAASANKLEARRRFAAAGLIVPWNIPFTIRSDEQRAADDPRVAFPCVLKPLGLSASRGVIRANDRQEFVAAFRRIRALLQRPDVRVARTGLENTLLVEGFVPGREFALEGVLTDGTLQVFTIFDKPDPLDGPFFEETIYVAPSALDQAAQSAIVETVQRSIRALGLRHGPIHAECRFGSDGPVMLEVAARPIGGLCSRTLRFQRGEATAAATASLEEVLLRHAIGEDVTGWRREPMASAVMMIPIPKRGVLRQTFGEAEACAVPHIEDVIITAKPDQLLEPLPEAGSYLGFIFARALTARQADAAVRDAHRRISFVIDAAIGLTAG